MATVLDAGGHGQFIAYTREPGLDGQSYLAAGP